MDYVSDVRIRRQSPHARRQRRLAQQQSSCCGCLLVVLSVVLATIVVWSPLARWREHRREIEQARAESQNYFPLRLSVKDPAYYRYALVPLTLELLDSQGRPMKVDNPPQLSIEHQGKAVETIGGVEQLTPKYDRATRKYTCRWPVPWNASPGRYDVSVRHRIRRADMWRWETAEEEVLRKRREKNGEASSKEILGEAFCVARTFFEVKARPPANIPNGICAATWEQSLPAPGAKMRRPSGKLGDWRTMFEWCEFIGADTLWVRGAVTRASDPPLTIEQPFVQANIDAIPRIAAEAHRHGLKFGVWAVAYATLPENTNKDKPKYRYAKDISRSTGEISDTAFISILDERRREGIAAFLRKMQATTNVDYVGLDYIRTEPGYELTEQFAQQMPVVGLPSNWERMSRVQQWQYVAKRAEPPGCFEYQDFYESWNWYRAHLGAGAVSDIIKRAELEKPLWLFTLSWKHGTQHGQDPLMFTDAGASMIAPMLYQVESRKHYDFILNDWKGYIKPGQVNLVCGDQVDNFWHQKLGPEELYRRMMQAHNKFVNGGITNGGFWHDISRAAMVGSLGPYPASEWGLAGGAAFSKIRESWGVHPLKANLVAPADATVDVPFEMQINIENLSEKPVRQIHIKPMSTAYVKYEKPEPQIIPQLGPGQRLTIPLRVRITQKSDARKNRFMAAARITWPEGNYGKEYENGLPPVIILATGDYIKAR